MRTHVGFFELQTPHDLLQKARNDLERLRANQMDTYAAFDFFVTARHIPEWLHPKDSASRDRHFSDHVELRVCRHLADGAKHFILTHKQHQQVQTTTRLRGVWGGSWGNRWGNSWGRNVLIVQLDPADSDTSLLGSRISALDLAEKVLSILEQIVTD